MIKILLSILVFVLVSNVFVQAAPTVALENEDVKIALTRLHEEVDRIRRSINPMPDLITFASNDVAVRMKHYVRTKRSKDEADTVFVDLKVDPDEDLGLKYVNLYIDTNRDMNARYNHLDEDSDYVDTKVVYLNIKPAYKNRRYLSYPRYRRHRHRKIN